MSGCAEYLPTDFFDEAISLYYKSIVNNTISGIHIDPSLIFFLIK